MFDAIDDELKERVEAIAQYLIAERYSSYMSLRYDFPRLSSPYEISEGLVEKSIIVNLDVTDANVSKDAARIRKDHPDLVIECVRSAQYGHFVCSPEDL